LPCQIAELAGFEQHPLSAVFPAMAAAELAELRADIAAHGLRHAITLYINKVLDGWPGAGAAAKSAQKSAPRSSKGPTARRWRT
jgi:hypothetical protein